MRDSLKITEKSAKYDAFFDPRQLVRDAVGKYLLEDEVSIRSA